MKSSSKFTVLTIVLVLLVSSTVIAGGFFEKINVYFHNLKIEVDGNNIVFDTEPFIYNDRVFVPVRFISEGMGGEVEWDHENKKVLINSYKDFPDCDPINGEIFVYGLITAIDYDNRTIEIEQHYDDNSVEVTPLLQIKDDAIFILQRNNKKMNIDLEDLKCGDDVGLILDKDEKVRGMIITF